MGYPWYFTGIYYVSRFAKQSNNYLPMILVSGSVIPISVTQIYPYVTETYIEDPVMLMALGGFLSILIAFLAIQQLFTVKPIAREKIFTDVESPIVIFDEDLNLKDSNTAYSRLENKEEVELKEILVDEISLIETSTTKTIEYANRMYTATVSPIQIFGKSSGYAVILEDITELQKQKQQLKRTNKHFEKFSDSTAHELRNPLTVITGCADYIQSEETDEELQEMARRILEQGSQIESLSADFKTVMEAAQTLEEKQMITVESVINQEFEKQEYNKIESIKLTTDAEVKAGLFRFPQIFNNLFNFIQVNVEDNEKATIICTVKEDSLYITVTGIGINTSSVEGLLEHGYSTHHNGTGLALSVVETISEVHGWKAEIEPAGDGFTLIFSNLETANLERKNTELI
jgi:signal transduction histidine kinase